MRAGLEPAVRALDSDGFEDETGHAQMSFAAAYALARAFAAAEPETVTMDIAHSEEEDRAQGFQPGEHWYHDYLRKQRPVFALARQWAGLGAEAERLRKEIDRMQRLVHEAIRDLRRFGADREANRLERALIGK